MPQLIALALAGTAAYLGYKWLSANNQRMPARVRRPAPARRPEPRNLGDLEHDETTGVYRPRQDN